jgi:alkaline phosphatase
MKWFSYLLAFSLSHCSLSQLKTDKSNLLEVAALYGLDDLTLEELEKLNSSKNIGADMVKMLAERAHIGYSTGGHTGEDVFLYSYGPSRPTGLVENTDLAKKMAQFMGFDLSKLSKELFVNAENAFEKKGYSTRLDVTDRNNPVFIAEKDNYKVEIPANKNMVILKTGKSIKQKETKTISVYNGKDFYVSEQALKLVK